MDFVGVCIAGLSLKNLLFDNLAHSLLLLGQHEWSESRLDAGEQRGEKHGKADGRQIGLGQISLWQSISWEAGQGEPQQVCCSRHLRRAGSGSCGRGQSAVEDG
jgi:hypothetical protein